MKTAEYTDRIVNTEALPLKVAEGAMIATKTHRWKALRSGRGEGRLEKFLHSIGPTPEIRLGCHSLLRSNESTLSKQKGLR